MALTEGSPGLRPIGCELELSAARAEPNDDEPDADGPDDEGARVPVAPIGSRPLGVAAAEGGRFGDNGVDADELGPEATNDRGEGWAEDEDALGGMNEPERGG